MQFLGASLGASEHAIPKMASAVPGNIKFSSNVCCVVVEYVGGGTVKVRARSSVGLFQFTLSQWLSTEFLVESFVPYYPFHGCDESSLGARLLLISKKGVSRWQIKCLASWIHTRMPEKFEFVKPLRYQNLLVSDVACRLLTVL